MMSEIFSTRDCKEDVEIPIDLVVKAEILNNKLLESPQALSQKVQIETLKLFKRSCPFLLPLQGDTFKEWNP